MGQLDILVNNAGIIVGGRIDQLSTDTWDNAFAVMLRAPFLCTRAAFRIMKEQGGGRIINIGSIAGQRVRPDSAPYSSAKFGLEGLTHCTALDGREFGITCGCLCPGNTRTEQRDAGTELMDMEPMMSLDDLSASAVFMACQPPHVNIFQLIVFPRDQLYVGRG